MDDGRREGFVEDCLDFPVDFDEPGKRVLHDGLTFPHDIIQPALHAVSFLFLEEPAFCFPGNGPEPFFLGFLLHAVAFVDIVKKFPDNSCTYD